MPGLRTSRRRSRLRRAATGLAVSTAALAAWEAVRRHDARVLAADADWADLNTPLGGRDAEVISADGTRLHVEVFGPDEAPTIVLVHGWTCELRIWHGQIRSLSARYRVVAFDQRGHGRSEMPGPGGYTADALAADIRAVLDACVPANRQCLLVGHSMGGMALVAWAGRHGAEVRRRLAGALLVDTGVSDLVAEALGFHNAALLRVHRAVSPQIISLAAPLPAYSSPVLRRLYRLIVMSPGASPGRVAFCERMLLRCPAKVRAGFGRLLSELDIAADLPRLDVPTTVIVGGVDRLTPAVHSRRMAAALPRLVELVEIPGVGHHSPVEAPGEVTQRIRELAASTLVEREPVAARG